VLTMPEAHSRAHVTPCSRRDTVEERCPPSERDLHRLDYAQMTPSFARERIPDAAETRDVQYGQVIRSVRLRGVRGNETERRRGRRSAVEGLG